MNGHVSITKTTHSTAQGSTHSKAIKKKLIAKQCMHGSS